MDVRDRVPVMWVYLSPNEVIQRGRITLDNLIRAITIVDRYEGVTEEWKFTFEIKIDVFTHVCRCGHGDVLAYMIKVLLWIALQLKVLWH